MVLQLILTFPNSRQVDPLGKAGQSKWSSLLSVTWLQYWEYERTNDLLSVWKTRVYISFLFIFWSVWWFVYDWSSVIIVPNKPIKALHIEDSITTFVTIAKIDSNFLNFICIARVIYSLSPEVSGKTDGFSFLYFN